MVLAGDFNTPARSRSLAPIRAMLDDVWLVSGRGWGATMTADFPVARIDQVWVEPARLRPLAAWVHHATGSDHRMVVADVAIAGR